MVPRNNLSPFRPSYRMEWIFCFFKRRRSILREEVLEKLNTLNIEYKEITHGEVFTIEEMETI